MSDSKNIPADLEAAGMPESGPAEPSANLPTRLAFEIAKPKDWQAFQRNCVILFKAVLDDPHAQEYGRSGQNQRGIDILGKRDGNPQHYVGVQCRLITKPLKHDKMLEDCRAALTLDAGLKEIIFATTAPQDARATDDAVAIERTLRSEGHDVTVVVYGWEGLQLLIAEHPTAYAAFSPSSVGTSAGMSAAAATSSAEFATQVANAVVQKLHNGGFAPPPSDSGASGSNAEDPALHARIDAFRDLFKDEKQPLLAEKGLLGLLQTVGLDEKPWARFRIETNLASIALELGREEDGAARYEVAYAIRPEDANAIANLALARVIQGRHDEAMELATKALNVAPPAPHAVAYLLQAAARGSWTGDPQSLIPAQYAGTPHADLGLAEFLRLRQEPDWAQRVLELAERHREVEVFKHIRGIAVLELAIKDDRVIAGGRGLVTFEQMNSAADDMKSTAEACLANAYADIRNLAAFVSNAGLLLRLTGRHEECEALLQEALPKVQDESQIRRLLALAQAAQDRPNDAIATLDGDTDPENRLLATELVGTDDPAKALAICAALDPATLDPRLAHMRWIVMGEFALRAGDMQAVQAAVSGLRQVDPADMTAHLLEIRAAKRAGADDEELTERMRAVVAGLPPSISMVDRFILADALRRQDLPDEAVAILESSVDVTRKGPATTLYLQTLAEARRDDAFRKALAAASPAVREDPEVLWIAATHAWNIGDLAASFEAVGSLLRAQPDNARARLLRVEILIREDRSAELFAALDERIEDLSGARLKDQYRVAAILGYFGYVERAGTLAYRLFLEHRDDSQAWMTLTSLVLHVGRGASEAGRVWEVTAVGPHVAVDLKYDDGEQFFFVVEPDSYLRQLDNESWEPEHPLVKTLSGLGKDSRFTAPDGRAGTIIELRHKYVARFQYVMRRHESRFPLVKAFRSVSVNVQEEGGLAEVISELKKRHDWVEQQYEQYRNGPWPLGVLAARVGGDTIEVGTSIAALGLQLKVAIGNEPERTEAERAIRLNAGRGCVLDLLAFWTAHQLSALQAVQSVCGQINLPQSVMDGLRARRETLQASQEEGLKTMGYEDGRIRLHEVDASVVQGWREELDRAIDWAQTNATILPVVAAEELPPELREYLRDSRSHVFDSVVLAKQAGLLLVTDDLPTRSLSRLVGGNSGTWLHRIFDTARDAGFIDSSTFIRWSAHLIDAGHNYVGVTGRDLAGALRLDAETGEAPGYLFKNLVKQIGGRGADPRSHLRACLECVHEIWSDGAAEKYHARATGLLLRQLLRERHDDYIAILRAFMRSARRRSALFEYTQSWARGHFIPDALLYAT